MQEVLVVELVLVIRLRVELEEQEILLLQILLKERMVEIPEHQIMQPPVVVEQRQLGQITLVP
jgi:hypothetical protein